MFFQLRELLRWLGLTVFEIWTALVCFTIFTVLLTLRVDNIVSEDSLNWWIVFSPLFVCDALNAYFCVFVFKYLLCQKLSGSDTKLEYSEVMSPVFILLQL